jgi:hydroxyacylglutathione hydrolase
MSASLERLAALPDDTEVYCAHEYTALNLRFAAAVEPDNPAIRRRIVEVEALRARGEPSVPSTLGLEKATNPFLRCREPAVIAAATQWRERQMPHGEGGEDGGGMPGEAGGLVGVFAALRAWRNVF